MIRKTRNIASNFLLAFIFLLGISLIIYKKRISIPPKTRRIKINEIQAILIYFEIKKEIIIVDMIMDNNIDMGWLNIKKVIINKDRSLISENSI